jgi:chromosome segregation ATPase
MENLRKKNETEMQNKMEDQSCKIEQTEDRISELKDKMVIKGKTKELLLKQLKTCEKKMQELTDTIKRPKLRITGIEEGEEVQEKGMCRQNNCRKFPKSRENYAHTGKGNLQNSKQT